MSNAGDGPARGPLASAAVGSQHTAAVCAAAALQPGPRSCLHLVACQLAQVTCSIRSMVEASCRSGRGALSALWKVGSGCIVWAPPKIGWKMLWWGLCLVNGRGVTCCCSKVAFPMHALWECVQSGVLYISCAHVHDSIAPQEPCLGRRHCAISWLVICSA
jgi:hypothetical protein